MKQFESFEYGEMSVIDILASAVLFLNSEDTEDNLLSEGNIEYIITPMYNLDGEITTYYVLLGDSYAVVNNNPNNPTVIEFGEGGNDLIDELIENKASAKIIYNDPFEVFYLGKNIKNYGSVEALDEQFGDFNENYPQLSNDDNSLIQLHALTKEILTSDNPEISGRIAKPGSGWGFINTADLPSGSYTSANITGISGSWAITGDYTGKNLNGQIVDNHCGAVAVTNLAYIFSRRSGNSNLVLSTKASTFSAVHKVVKNGPKVTIASDAVTYFKNRGFTLKHASANTTSSYKTAIGNNRPVGLLTQRNLEAHWIVGIGYRTYGSNTYFRIVNGWHDSSNKYYLPNSGSAWISGTSYYLG